MTMSEQNDFYTSFAQACQLKKGDIIDVCSDLREFMIYFYRRKETFDPNRLIDALQQAVGEEGTILIRTFNWDFCHGTPFDRRNTPGLTGALGNIALKRPDFVRTKHALYSWCVWGKERAYLTEIDPVDSFGDDSVFAWLEEKDATFLRIGATAVTGFTSIHRVEERAKIPFRYIKQFTGQYIDYNGNVTEKTYTMFVRNLDYDMHMKEKEYGAMMIKRGILKVVVFERVHIAKASLKEFSEIVYHDIITGHWSDYCDCKPLPKKKCELF